MPRTYERKTERANIAPDIILRAVRMVRLEKKSIRSTAKMFDIPHRSLTRYCKKATDVDLAEVAAKTPTFNIGYTKLRKVQYAKYCMHKLFYFYNKMEILQL